MRPFAALLFATVALAQAPVATTPLESVAGTPKPFALLELFVSEGCDACPKPTADLNALLKDGALLGRNVLPITWHVDYWNDLVEGQGPCRGAWVDRFATGLATARQFAYARALKSHPATPQLVSNGKELAGEISAASLRAAAEKQLAAPAPFGLRIALDAARSAPAKGRLVVDFALEVAPKADRAALRKQFAPQVVVVLLENGLVSKPDRGENCGATLPHEHVVRAFAAATSRTLERGSLVLDVPSDVRLEACEVAAFVQSLHTLEVLGGTRGFALRRP